MMRIFNFWKPFLWFLLVCYMLFSPVKNAPSRFLQYLPVSLLDLIKEYPHILDKIVHFSLFFVLCLLLFRPFKKINSKYTWLASFISGILAVVMERFQHVISISRHYDVNDFYANILGVFVATSLYFIAIKGSVWEKYL